MARQQNLPVDTILNLGDKFTGLDQFAKSKNFTIASLLDYQAANGLSDPSRTALIWKRVPSLQNDLDNGQFKFEDDVAKTFSSDFSSPTKFTVNRFTSSGQDSLALLREYAGGTVKLNVNQEQTWYYGIFEIFDVELENEGTVTFNLMLKSSDDNTGASAGSIPSASNDNVYVSLSPLGVGSGGSGNTGPQGAYYVELFKRSSTDIEGQVGPSDVVWTEATEAITGANADGWSVNIPSGTDQLYIVNAFYNPATSTNISDWSTIFISGHQGADGDTGVGISNVLIGNRKSNGFYDMTINYTDGTTQTITDAFEGGIKGDTGISITNVTVGVVKPNNFRDLTITYSEGNPTTITDAIKEGQDGESLNAVLEASGNDVDLVIYLGAGNTTNEIARHKVNGTDGQQGPQGQYDLEIFKPSSVAISDAPIGGSYNGTTLTAPATWYATYGAAQAAAADGDTIYESRSGYNPATESGTVTPLWSIPFAAGAQGPSGMPGSGYTNFVVTPDGDLTVEGTGTNDDYGPVNIKGSTGSAAGFGTITAETGPIGVVATGPDTGKNLVFSIPQGQTGIAGNSVTIENVDTSDADHYSFSIVVRDGNGDLVQQVDTPDLKGNDGDKGDQGIQGPQGIFSTKLYYPISNGYPTVPSAGPADVIWDVASNAVQAQSLPANWYSNFGTAVGLSADSIVYIAEADIDYSTNTEAQFAIFFATPYLAGSQGPSGVDGRSAYEIAVQDGGFVGTEQEWLASLDGSNGVNGVQGLSRIELYRPASSSETDQPEGIVINTNDFSFVESSLNAEWQIAFPGIGSDISFAIINPALFGEDATYAIDDNAWAASFTAGAQGAQGPAGPAGKDGGGLKVGGNQGQIIVKASNDTDFDTAWVSFESGAAGNIPVYFTSTGGTIQATVDGSGHYIPLKPSTGGGTPTVGAHLFTQVTQAQPSSFDTTDGSMIDSGVDAHHTQQVHFEWVDDGNQNYAILAIPTTLLGTNTKPTIHLLNGILSPDDIFIISGTPTSYSGFYFLLDESITIQIDV